MSIEEIRDYLNVDTLAYLSLDRLVAATGAVGAGFCTACLTGEYPVPIPEQLHKGLLEDQPAAVDVGEPSTLGLLFEQEVDLPARQAEGRDLPGRG
jgi:amidophosphoribosyltransferase